MPSTKRAHNRIWPSLTSVPPHWGQRRVPTAGQVVLPHYGKGRTAAAEPIRFLELRKSRSKRLKSFFCPCLSCCSWFCRRRRVSEGTPREGVRWIKTGTQDIVNWLPKSTGKYWRGLLPNGAKLDLFLASPESCGAIFLIRTGSANFSHALVTFARFKVGSTFDGGELVENKTGFVVPTPEEEDVSRILNLQYIEPKQRTGPEAILPVRGTRGKL